MGTLVTLDTPWPALVEGLLRRHGVTVSLAQAEHALRAEIAYYRAHHHEGADHGTLRALRLRCAEALRDALPAAAAEIPVEELLGTLLGALRFRAFPDAAPALAELRGAGVRLVVVSNWDVSLHDVLAESGLSALLDDIVTSAEVGVAKPAAEMFSAGLRAAGGIEPSRAMHVGDDLAHDVEGARALGIGAVLICRDGEGRAPAGVPVISTLAELPALVHV
jgi:putative hydrolase of the HAD superfamily